MIDKLSKNDMSLIRECIRLTRRQIVDEKFRLNDLLYMCPEDEVKDNLDRLKILDNDLERLRDISDYFRNVMKTL